MELNLYYNFIFLFFWISNVKDKESFNNLEPEYEKIGESSTKYLNYTKESELFFKSESKSQLLLVHFFPIDCEIKINTINPEENYKKIIT